MNTTTKTLVSLAIVAAFIVGIALLVKSAPAPTPEPNTPAQTGNADITIANLLENAAISLPMTFTGEVIGNYFFEGSFPVFLKDPSGNVLATGIASSTSDWMTTNHIPFTVTIPAVNYQGPATIVFHNDNPSGEPQFDKSFTVPVIIQ